MRIKTYFLNRMTKFMLFFHSVKLNMIQAFTSSLIWVLKS